MPHRLLIVDDEIDMLHLLRRSITQELGCEVECAGSGVEALERLSESSFDLALLDIRMPKMDGMELLSRIRANDPWITVVMMTAYGAVEVAVEAMKKGAWDFVTKPFDHDEIIMTIQKGLERCRLLRENAQLRKRVREEETFQNFVGASTKMQSLYDTLQMLAKTDVTVLITGESGTGKNIAARAIHDLSPRAGGPFVRVSCPTVPEQILESELFGYAKGAFTHATSDKKGLIAEADGGTLFLDEIGDISPLIQTKLLQVLEEKEFKPLGKNKPQRVNVRIIAATNADLKSKMKDNAFREDLYFRLCVMDVHLPPLRERKEDILPLTQHFIARFRKEHNLGPKRVSRDLMDLFMAHRWKGNVRELMNLIQRAVIMTPGEVVGPSEAGFKPEFPDCTDSMARIPDLPYREAKNAVVGSFTRRYLSRALERSGGNVTQAARDSGLERQSFQQIMKKSGLKSEDFRPDATD